MESTQKNITSYLSRFKAGDLVFPTDFRGQGSADAIKMALSRLAKEGRLQRLAHGIYYIPQQHHLFGIIYPSAEKVAEGVAKKEKIKIKPTGAYALHRLGLTTQVPTQLVYLTDGESRQIKMGKMTIRFKSTTPKKMALQGQISGLLIQALDELGLETIDENTIKKIKDLLAKEDKKKLKHDLKLAPAKIHDFIIKLYPND
jgi:hypothetical protein